MKALRYTSFWLRVCFFLNDKASWPKFVGISFFFFVAKMIGFVCLGHTGLFHINRILRFRFAQNRFFGRGYRFLGKVIVFLARLSFSLARLSFFVEVISSCRGYRFLGEIIVFGRGYRFLGEVIVFERGYQFLGEVIVFWARFRPR